jgi:hypothetical protein
MTGERDSLQSAFDLFREQAIQDGLGDVIRELDAFFQERPVKPQAPQPG